MKYSKGFSEIFPRKKLGKILQFLNDSSNLIEIEVRNKEFNTEIKENNFFKSRNNSKGEEKTEKPNFKPNRFNATHVGRFLP